MSSSSFVQLAGRYQLEDQIATGGYGQVWRATDVVLARLVAVKLLMRDHVQHPQALARFRTEAQRAGSLSHENIARVYDYIEPAPPEPPFLVMELVDGPSLAAVLGNGRIDAARAMHIVAGAAAGLQAAHEAGLVHRDIKPANLLLTRNDRVKVTDFGISYAVNSVPMTSTDMLFGTPGYLAPERLSGAGVSAPADLYALGIVAYECLTGAQPFTGMPLEVAVAHRDQPLPPLPSSVPAEVAGLVTRLTAKDPAARPDSADEVARWAAQLRDRLTGVPQVPPAVSPAAPSAVSPAAPSAVPPAALVPGPRVPPPLPPRVPHRASDTLDQLGHETPELGEGYGSGLPHGGRRPHGGRWIRGGRRAGLAAAAALVLAVIGLVAARMIGAGPPSTAASGGRATPGASTAQMIEVNGASLIGHPVSAAVQQLHGLGLTVRVIWQPAGQRPPGTVLAVSPSGRVAPHTLITLTGAQSPVGRGSTGTFPPGASPAPGGNAFPVSAQSPGTGTTAPGSPPSTDAGSSPSASPTPSATSGESNGNGNGNGQGNGNGGGNGKGKG